MAVLTRATRKSCGSHQDSNRHTASTKLVSKFSHMGSARSYGFVLTFNNNRDVRNGDCRHGVKVSKYQVDFLGAILILNVTVKKPHGIDAQENVFYEVFKRRSPGGGILSRLACIQKSAQNCGREGIHHAL